MTLLTSLTAREEGRASPHKMKWMELTRQAIHLHLSNKVILKQIHNGGITALAIDPVEGRYLLSGGVDAQVVLFDLESQKMHDEIHPLAVIQRRPFDFMPTEPHVGAPDGGRYGHGYAISSVNWYPYDTGLFTSASMDGTIKVWDTNALKEAVTFSLDHKVYAHAMSPVARRSALIAAGTSDPKIRLCDLRSGAFTHQLIGHRQAVMTLQWLPLNEYQLVSGSHDGTVRLWDIRASGGPQQCLMYFDLQNVFKKGDSNAVYVNERKRCSADAESHRIAHHGAVNGLSITSDGLHLITAGLDNRVRLWDMVTGKNMLVNYPEIANSRLRQVFFSTTYDYPTRPAFLFFPVKNAIHMYDLFSGELITKLDDGHYDEIQAIIRHPTLMRIFSAGSDQQILPWTGEDERSAAEIFDPIGFN